ncbi:HMG domain-containing protein 4 [Spea bombifrons]|uniref:HMG domain-containing protein 4 n=1 Tax=Spea bombifrons TaxID=233779 RepID=UPI00234BF21D|nr:HMG domain-containing protein 4 [Spea bombifrons]XP_053325173.1 HMG domain-containing protein 4 [Spea bombifrons]
MAYSDLRASESLDTERGMEDVGLAAGRTQREKKRSYKDLLREEEEIAEQVRKSSKKRPKEPDFLPPGSESHKKKKKHSSDDAFYTDSGSPDFIKKKKKPPLPGPSSPSSDTAMDLLKAITSSQTSSSKPPSKKAEKILAPPVNFPSSSQIPSKEHRKKIGDMPTEDPSHRAKKPKPLTLREPDGLKMKLILSPTEKTEEPAISPQVSPVLSDGPGSKKSSKKVQREESESRSSHKKHKKESHAPRHGDSASSSGGELEAGELVIDDSFCEVKKKKKSKKSKKKKDKHKDEKHRKHSKSKREHGSDGSPTQIPPPTLPSSPAPAGVTPPPATLSPPVLITHAEVPLDKKKKKEETDKPKKKNMSAYQVFSKEYRGSIIAEHPGIDFGELSKKLAEVWKQLPEKDKLAWKQKAQYLQHKQNKAEATTVKRKSSSSEATPKSKGSPSGVSSPHKKSPSSVLSFSSSPAKVPDTEPIDVAAHLQLLGESLSLIGHRLQETEGMVAVSGSLSVLLDSILCALGPLVCLTSHVPQLNACPKQVLSNTLDNIAYVMPGL